MAAAAVRPFAFVAPPSVRPRRSTVAAGVSARLATTIPTLQSASSSSPPLPLTPEKKKVLVPIGMGTEEMEAVILVDVLRRAGADVLVASVEQELQVLASSGTRLVADASIEDCAHQVFDLVALPGGMPGSVRLRDCEILRNMMIRHTEGKRLYGAICAAPAVTLMPWGLHKKKQITCHPAFIDKLPTFRAVKSNVQVSGELTTSRGPGTAFEFALSLIQQLFGDDLTKDIGRKLFIQDDGCQQRKEEFNKVEWSFNENPHVLVPIANGSEEMEVVILVDILRRAKMNVVVASVEKSKQIIASHSTKIVADKSIADASTSAYDLIILPGGISGVERFQKSRILKKLLRQQIEAGRIYGGISSSPTILQKQGLLKDKVITAHPAVIGELTGKVVERPVVLDGKLITSRGLGTVIDLSLAIIHKFYGHGRARSVAEGLVFKYPQS